MRVLHAIHSVDPRHGGTTSAVQTLAHSCASLGHPSDVLCLDSPSSPWLTSWQTPIQAAGPGLTHYGWNTSFPRALANKRPLPDVVVVHGLWQHHAVAARRYCLARRIPYVVAPHGMLDPWALRQSGAKRLLKTLNWHLLTRAVLKDAAAVWFTTSEEQTAAASALGKLSVQQRVARLGVPPPPEDLKQIAEEWRTQHPELAHRALLLFFGRIHPKKGCDLLIEGFAKWRQDGSAPTSHLRFVGPCSDASYLLHLKSLCAAQGLADGKDVSFAGLVSGRNKWQELAAAETFILPSHQENFGIAVVEALACGTPVLLSDRVNLCDEVLHANAGLVSPPSAAGVSQMLATWESMSEAERQRMRDEARALYARNYRPEVAALMFVNMLTSLPDGLGASS